jgi:predicted ATPase/DNA-binding SARP family transcriptional activator
MAQIPVQLTSFIGREWEVEEVSRLARQMRLLTLTGSGGCGKTRLAAEVAAGIAPTFAHGLWWVDLAGLTEPAFVPQAVAQALALPEVANQPFVETLSHYLHDREALLVLDNCEHLVGACAGLAERLLRAATQLHILTTSREALGVAGEVIWFVPSLSFPEPGSESWEGERSLLQYDAIRLFVERATAVLPSFALAEQDLTAVVQLCHRLDGIPLAIELAAARVRLLQVEQIATRLDDRFRLLTGSSRTVLPRHQTLHAAIEWSYELLSEPERHLFRQLAVFVGSFSLEAAEDISTGPGFASADVLDLLTQLTNKSLLLVERAPGQPTRFRLLETIRHYALVKLRQAGEAEPAHRRHRDYFLALVETAEPHLIGPVEMTWLERLEREHDNFGAALAWSMAEAQGGDAKPTLRLVSALAEFWIRRGYLVEGGKWLAGARAYLAQASRPVQAKLLFQFGSLLNDQGDASQAHALLQESLLAFESIGDDRNAGWVLSELGYCAHYYLNEVAQGLAYLARSEAFARAADDKALLSAVYAQRGVIAMRQAAHNQAAEWHERSLVLARQTGSQKVMASQLFFAGLAAVSQGEHQRATALFEESLALARQLKDQALIQTLLAGLGELARLEQAYARATALYEESLAGARQLGLRELVGSILQNLGHIALRQGKTEAARALFVESLSLGQELNHKELISYCLAGLAGVAGAEGWPARAARLFGAADRLLAALQLQPQAADQVEYEHNLALARRQLNEATFAAAWAEGQALSLEQAIAAALEKRDERTAAEKEVVSGVTSVNGPAGPALRLVSLGRVEVYRDDRLLVAADWTFAKPKELLFYLLCHPPRSKEQIGLVFWPDASPEQLRGSLRATLYRLRQALGRPEWIRFEDGRYGFNRSLDYWFDVEAFTAHLAQAKQVQTSNPEQALHHLDQAVQLYQGDFLAELAADEWCWSRREELREQWLAARLDLGQLYMAQGRYREAADSYRQTLTHDNLLEAAHRQLIRCYARLGERRRAVHHYQTLVNLLRDELGVSPEPDTSLLFERLRLGQPL